MSYPIKYRERTIEYRKEGHTLEETKATFKVSISTIRKWESQLKEKGDLRPKTLTRKPKKIEPEKLRAYVAEHPDAYQREIAREFNCTQSAVQKALKRLKITRKKSHDIRRTKLRQSSWVQVWNSWYSSGKHSICRWNRYWLLFISRVWLWPQRAVGSWSNQGTQVYAYKHCGGSNGKRNHSSLSVYRNNEPRMVWEMVSRAPAFSASKRNCDCDG